MKEEKLADRISIVEDLVNPVKLGPKSNRGGGMFSSNEGGGGMFSPKNGRRKDS